MIAEILNVLVWHGWEAACVLMVHGICVLNHMGRQTSNAFRCAHLLMTMAAAGLVFCQFYGGQGRQWFLLMLLIGALARKWVDRRTLERAPLLLGDFAVWILGKRAGHSEISTGKST